METDDRRIRCRGPRGSAFTLLELLVVVAVTALLISILLPSFHRARENARRTVCLAQLKHIGVALFTYANANQDAGPAVGPIRGNNTSPRTLLSKTDLLVNLGLLWPTEITDPETFLCPSQREFFYNSDVSEIGERYVFGSYAYAVHIRAEQSPRLGKFRHLAMVADDFTKGHGTDTGIGKYSHRTAYNVLYTDGSAVRYPDENESIWPRAVYWDDESDEYDYASFYDSTGNFIDDDAPYEGYADVFRIWHSFCYSTPDPF